MELTSASLHKAQVSWRGLLLTVSLLTYWNSPITALFVTVEAIPPIVAVGNSVLLAVHDMPLDYGLFSWYKEVNSGKQFIASCTPRPNSIALEAEFRDKVEMYRNVSLLIRNVSKDEGGRYRKVYIKTNTQEVGLLGNHLSVVSTTPLPKTNITTNNSNPMEGEDSVALMCEPETQNTAYLWRINDQSLSEESRLKLLEDNRTLILLSVVRTDTGHYECEPGTQPGFSLPSADITCDFILFAPDDSDNKPYICCHTDTNAPPQYSWFVNGELQSSSQELYIPNINTNKSGSYTCLFNNSGPILCLSIDPVTTPSIQVNKTIGKDLVSVFLKCPTIDIDNSVRWFFKGQSLRITNTMTLSQNNRTLEIVPAKSKDSGNYQCEVSNPLGSKISDPFQLDVIVFQPINPNGCHFLYSFIISYLVVF
uniref:Ig-like domain-containing protein n=1 Tax=Peromyscus maniculatus bairdii TaxID=230844 RepID=A0A8C8UN24_PERMB